MREIYMITLVGNSFGAILALALILGLNIESNLACFMIGLSLTVLGGMIGLSLRRR